MQAPITRNLADLDLYALPLRSRFSFPIRTITSKKRGRGIRGSRNAPAAMSAIKDLLWMDDKMSPSFDGIIEIVGAKDTPWGRFTDEQTPGDAQNHVAQRMKNPHMAGEMGWRPFPGVWGIKDLPIELTPA